MTIQGEEGGSPKKILLVEDEPVFRTLVENLLKKNGYEVVAVEDGKEALQVLRSDSGPWHALITDYNMPNMNGRDLLLSLAKLKVDFRAVLMTSGYTTLDPEMDGLRDFKSLHTLTKPYDRKDLLRILQEAN